MRKRIVLLFVGLLNISALAGVVTIYPSPGDLSEVEGLQESGHFDLSVDGKDAFVYFGFEHNQRGLSSQGVSYCNFAFEDKVDLSIKTEKEIQQWNIKPEVKSAKKNDGKTISLSLDKPRKFLVSVKEVSGPWRYFIVSAEAPFRNIPIKDDPSVIYLGPGVHHKGQAWEPFKGGKRTLFLAGGAVLEASLKTKNTDDIKILGPGLMCGVFIPHAKEASKEKEWDIDWIGVSIRSCKNVLVEGIGIIGMPSYQLEFADCDNVVARNVKCLGYGERNNDGIHTYSRDVVVEDCFVASNDDRICLTGLFDADNGTDDKNWDGTEELVGCLVENVIVRDTILWGMETNGADIMLTWNGSDQARNVSFENIYSLNMGNKAFISARHGGSGLIHNVVFRRCHLYHNRLYDIIIRKNPFGDVGGGSFSDFHLQDIEMKGAKKDVYVQLLGKNPKSDISRFSHKRITANGELITDLNQTKVKKNQYVSDFLFE